MLGIIVALSGIEHAHALTTLDTGAPLYLKSVDTVANACAASRLFSATSDGTASLTSDGLSASFMFPSGADSTHLKIPYYEITAASTDMSIAVYNFDAPRHRVHEITVPIATLGTISEDPPNDSYTIKPIHSTVNHARNTGANEIFINHPEITVAIYLTLDSFQRGERFPPVTVILNPESGSTGLFRGVEDTRYKLVASPRIIECSVGSAQVSPSVEFGYTDGRGVNHVL
ncbi:MAG: hypothetical protein EB828_06545 [Nitrosopumilus sp. D6]|nr:MAG: hypothetical protein EB828_06545 [Nitrosopumilus sp. D6]